MMQKFFTRNLWNCSILLVTLIPYVRTVFSFTAVGINVGWITTAATATTSTSNHHHSFNTFQQQQQQQQNNKNRVIVEVSSSSSTDETTSTTTSTTSSSDTGNILPSFEKKEEYISYLSKASSLPQGFAVGTSIGSFVPVEAPGLGPLKICGAILYLTNGPTDSWAAVFTKNKFPGDPIKVGKSRLSSGQPIQAIFINNKVSNVCSGSDNGMADSELICSAVSKALNLQGDSGDGSYVLPSSTGVIGWRLPTKELVSNVIPNAAADILKKMKKEEEGGTMDALLAAESIMTTDRYPKLRSHTLSNGARIVGIAKGAGMIEPNMATMLCYIMTDAKIEKSKLQSMLSKTVDETFNSISVDGDESTSDTVALLSSNIHPMETHQEDEFELALMDICKGLSSDIVRNGEGTGHILRVSISNFPGGCNNNARKLGRHIVNSPLVKCAVSGNDPNTGRIAGAIGSFMGKYSSGNDDDVDLDNMTLTLGGHVIFAHGKFVLDGDEGGDDMERQLSQHMKDAEFDEMEDFPRHQRFVEIGVDFGGGGGDNGSGSGNAVVLGSDLTAEYVSINADYRS